MRKIGTAAVALCLLLFLVRTPDYWKMFREERGSYRTETFYGIIKEEQWTDATGKTSYKTRLSDVETGDVLVTDCTYCFCYRHGHAALVVDGERGITLESFGLGTVSDYGRVADWKRYPHVSVLRLRAAKAVREAVAAYAKQALVGIPYRLSTGMIDDKDMEEEYWGTQCAHLVWAAFDRFGYDVDGDGGWLVTPADFLKSGWFVIVPQEE